MEPNFSIVCTHLYFSLYNFLKKIPLPSKVFFFFLRCPRDVTTVSEAHLVPSGSGRPEVHRPFLNRIGHFTGLFPIKSKATGVL